MKIAVVGNSHIAALKQALRIRAEPRTSMTFTFWGVPGKYFQAIECTSEYLISERSDIVHEVSDGAYDQLRFKAFEVIWLYAGDLDLAEMMDAFTDSGQIISNYSSALIKCGINAYLEGLRIVQLAKQIRQYFSGAIFLSPKPLPAQSQDFDDKNWQLDINQFERGIADYLNQSNVSLLPQPNKTRSSNRFTQSRFTIGSVRLPGDLKRLHPKDDRAHMNIEYGNIMLAEFISRLTDEQNRV